MIWLWAIPLLLALAALATAWASWALREPEEEREACPHPWYMEGRCLVCGEPR